MIEPLEIELKLEIDPVDRRRLLSAPPLADATGESRHLVSTYFDTPARDLLAAGFSLRVRRSGKRRIQTVKAVGDPSAGLYVRPEWERTVEDDQPRFDAGCGPIVGAVGMEVLGRIEPIFVTDMRRVTYRIEREGVSIDLAVDNGTIRASERTDRICEIELELRQGSSRALFDLARQLSERVPLRLGVRSKSERGYALAGGNACEGIKPEPIPLDRNGDAGTAFQVIAQACLRHFRLNEGLLMRADAAEPLHQARVALRRLRSLLTLYRPLLADGGPPASLRAGLRSLAADLGEVRNIDVLIRRFGDHPQDRLIAAREAEFAHARTTLASARTRRLTIDLVEWLAIGSWRSGSADPEGLDCHVVPFARDLLDRQHRRVKRGGKELARLGRRHRHQLRIEAKRLRYAAEFFASLYAGKKAHRRYERFAAALERLQDRLGELNDIAIGSRILATCGLDTRQPKSGKRRRRRLLDDAAQAYDELMRTKRFWHATEARPGRDTRAPGR